ncbi:hypothetical protein PRK78_002440 [Emydomyces testavorans]|uniref:Uncharacterized protein n=1 Tax=Emydomyces testavorans TaxID=2070801 RepID=A0AAF0IHT0_9EURO|nr:hypothetical protein PRK78_002440 [Emydomyces testavorans]
MSKEPSQPQQTGGTVKENSGMTVDDNGHVHVEILTRGMVDYYPDGTWECKIVPVDESKNPLNHESKASEMAMILSIQEGRGTVEIIQGGPDERMGAYECKVSIEDHLDGSTTTKIIPRQIQNHKANDASQEREGGVMHSEATECSTADGAAAMEKEASIGREASVEDRSLSTLSSDSKERNENAGNMDEDGDEDALSIQNRFSNFFAGVPLRNSQFFEKCECRSSTRIGHRYKLKQELYGLPAYNSVAEESSVFSLGITKDRNEGILKDFLALNLFATSQIKGICSPRNASKSETGYR